MIFTCIWVVFLGLFTCFHQPILDNLNDSYVPPIQEVEKVDHKKNKFNSTHYAYYTLQEIGLMLQTSLSSYNDIVDFGGSGYSGFYVLNNVGTYDLTSSFSSSTAIYSVDTSTNLNTLSFMSSYSITGVHFSTIEVDYIYRWVFDINYGNGGMIYITSVKSIDTFNGNQQTSYLVHVNQATTFTNYIYLMFDLDIWYDYLVYPDDLTIYYQGYQSGYDYGYIVGNDHGYAEGLSDSYDSGYQAGFQDGYDIGIEGGEATIIFGGILDVATIPVNVFLMMFNYEVFGINVAGLITGLVTICMIIILIRLITGKHL